MKHLHIFTVTGIFLLAIILMGFSFESSAIFNCDKCNQTYSDDLEKSKNDIENKSVCKKCAGKNRQKRSRYDTYDENTDNASVLKKSPPLILLKPYKDSYAHLQLTRRPIRKTDSIQDVYSGDTYCANENKVCGSTAKNICPPFHFSDIGVFLSTVMGLFEHREEVLMPPTLPKEPIIVSAQEIRDMLYSAEDLEDAYPAIICLLPDFVATYTLSENEKKQPTLLFERKTAEGIKFFLDKKISETTYLYIIVKNNRDSFEKKSDYYKFIIEAKDIPDRMFYFYSEEPIPQWRKISVKHLPEIIELCEQWANYHGSAIGVYEVTKYDKKYTTNDYYKENEFNDHELSNIIWNLTGGTYATMAEPADELLTCVRGDDSSVKTEKVNVPFIDWHQQMWPAPEQGLSYFKPSEQNFMIELTGITTKDQPNPRIVVKKLNILDRSYYGLNLLGHTTNCYFMLHKFFMDQFAKQLMWIARRVEIYEIKQ